MRAFILMVLLSSVISCDHVFTSSHGSNNSVDSPVPITDLSLNQISARVPLGGSDRLTVFVEPTNASDRNLSWSSDDESVVSVNSSGLIVGLNIGITTVTVSTEDGEHHGNCSKTGGKRLSPRRRRGEYQSCPLKMRSYTS